MILIRDFQQGDIIYYWSSSEGAALSPALPTLRKASDWRQSYINSTYKGLERRTSVYDRRIDTQMRRKLDEELFFSDESSYGRRVTDIPLRVDIDLVDRKLQKILLSSAKPDNEVATVRMA